MLLGPRGTCLEERDPPLLPGPGRLLILCPQPPPSTDHKDPRRTGRRSRGTPLTNSPLEFWELLFVSSKWFCALPSTRRLKALSAGWGRGESKKKKTHHGDWSVPGPKRGHAREGGGLGGQGRGTCPCPWTGWFPLCLGTSTVRGSRTPNHTLPASQAHLNCLTLPWDPRRSPNSAQRGRRSRRRGV